MGRQSSVAGRLRYIKIDDTYNGRQAFDRKRISRWAEEAYHLRGE